MQAAVNCACVHSATVTEEQQPLQPALSSTISSLYCNACQQLLVGELVRALEGTFHLDCFKCLDCQEPVASMFFPIETSDGSQQPLCEHDYFRRLKLVCDQCGDALKGSYITAVGKKFHLEHFCCNSCGDVFGPEDCYYEHNNNVYCYFHYSVKFAIKCTGCDTAILKQFVELNRNNVDEHWHPECYMINKFWNVKLAHPSGQSHSNFCHSTAIELRDAHVAMEEKVYRIWTVLSAFEDSSAACISDMLVHVSEGSYDEGVRMADYFITHVDVLFCAIDELAAHYLETLKEELHYGREAHMLCKKVTSFFALLSQTQVDGLRRIGITQDLLSLVTGLAQYLKVLIRLGLTGALKLENKSDTKLPAISRFLSQLVKLANGQQPSDALDYPTNADLCQTCRIVCDDQCYRFQSYRWHDYCFACSKCCGLLGDDFQHSFINFIDDNLILYCIHCGNKDTMVQGFEKVTKLQQFSFLLRVALKELYQLLGVDGVSPKVLHNSQSSKQRTSDLKENAHSTVDTKNLPSIPEPSEKETIQLGDIKRTKSTHVNRNVNSSRHVAKRSTLMETPSPTSAFITNQPENNKKHSGSLLIDIRPKRNNITNDENYDDSIMTDSPTDTHPQPTTTLNFTVSSHDDDSGISNNTVIAPTSTSILQSASQDYVRAIPKAKFYYFAELGSLDHYMLKHIAVLYLDDLLKDYFCLEELADLIDEKKHSTLWGKFVTSLKTGGNKKGSTKEGTFGVPLEILVEKNGVDSNMGASPTRIRIPSFVEEIIFAMKQMNVSVEGIFRKNGRIGELRHLCEEIDKNPNNINLMKENATQLAALIKKFLRDMPEPLLTFKLYRLFTTIQKLEKEVDRKRATHLACCLLPKPNRDTMEVLFLFIHWVSTFSQIGQDGGAGNKMNLDNMATMVAPNLLYSKNKDLTKENLVDDSLKAVLILLRHQEEFATVPEDFAPLLENLTYDEGDMELNVRHILKKCEAVMKMTRNQPGKHHHLSPPTTLLSPPLQHSSPATATITAPSSTTHSYSTPSTTDPSSHLTDHTHSISSNGLPLDHSPPSSTNSYLSSSPIDLEQHTTIPSTVIVTPRPPTLHSQPAS
ncbi:hypothetical protein BCR42DRAFT_404189 [Absidia repens]|uniref:RhoGAP-domain-containing protein n=1 Tax=Absidia repens TaxID=90262 RepID=A0A1X2IVU6_9FUNG|nr:hypothetical protein BCR42DRAFT_404189 [Absidia repens]